MLRNRPLDQLHTTEISLQVDVQLVPLSLSSVKHFSQRSKVSQLRRKFQQLSKKMLFQIYSQISVEHNRLLVQLDVRPALGGTGLSARRRQRSDRRAQLCRTLCSCALQCTD